VPRAPEIPEQGRIEEESRRPESERASITQSNTARLIRRKLRGCLPLSINFNSVRGPPTEGAPPLATSVRDPSREKEVRASLSLPFSIQRAIKKNRYQSSFVRRDPKMR